MSGNRTASWVMQKRTISTQRGFPRFLNNLNSAKHQYLYADKHSVCKNKNTGDADMFK